ncbi:PPP4R1 [Bugula neritina]|uniref:PPP4R1 n=1 Tax=Bugula neritina TaxID=10212 RepID=A0A7J7KL50_BUGNE|nr:PPP4R1 [Bugula neritina]KAF6039255.1 PPP4R1 [Bugula neritina]
MLINDLIEKLALSEKWHARQIYVQGCHRILKDHSIKSDQFSKELLPSIITLSIDKTPNVRISVAKLLSQELLHSDYFTGSQNPHHDDLMNAETKLKADVDSDVRYFANLPTEKLEQVSV